MEACSAMKPDCRPMSLTRPMPLRALEASTFAASSARCDSSTAVSKPKHLSICQQAGETCRGARQMPNLPDPCGLRMLMCHSQP